MQRIVNEEDQGRCVVRAEVQQKGVVEEIEPSESLRVVGEVLDLRVLGLEGERVFVDVCGRGGFGQRASCVFGSFGCIMCVYSYKVCYMCLYMHDISYDSHLRCFIYTYSYQV